MLKYDNVITPSFRVGVLCNSRSYILVLWHHQLRRYFHYRLAYAAIGGLYVQQCGEGGAYVGHVYLPVGLALRYVPAIPYEGYVGVVGVPAAVGHAGGLAAIVVPAGVQH